MLSDYCTYQRALSQPRPLSEGVPLSRALPHLRTGRQVAECLVLGLCKYRKTNNVTISLTPDVVGHRFGSPARSEIPFHSVPEKYKLNLAIFFSYGMAGWSFALLAFNGYH